MEGGGDGSGGGGGGGGGAPLSAQALGEGGVHVTYGGMSRKPVTAATSHMIFKVALPPSPQLQSPSPGPELARLLAGPVERAGGQERGEPPHPAPHPPPGAPGHVRHPGGHGGGGGPAGPGSQAHCHGGLQVKHSKQTNGDPPREALANTLGGFLPAKYVFRMDQ